MKMCDCISLRSTFGRKSHYYNFSILVEPMADALNKSFPETYLQTLCLLSTHRYDHENPTLLDDGITITQAPLLLY